MCIGVFLLSLNNLISLLNLDTNNFVVTETNLLIILNDDTYRHHLHDENNFKFDLLAQSGRFCFGFFNGGLHKNVENVEHLRQIFYFNERRTNLEAVKLIRHVVQVEIFLFC